MYQWQKKSIILMMTILVFSSCATKHTKTLESTTLKSVKTTVIKIVTDSKRYKLGESIDIEVSSSKEGFINILLINPNSKVVNIKEEFIKKELRMYTKVDMVGEYQLIVLLGSIPKYITARNFNLKKLGKKDIYDIYTFKVNR